MNFGDSLKRLRRERGLTQQQVADMLHIHKQAYQRYESEKVIPSIEFLVRIADIFEVSADYLLGRVKFAKGATVYLISYDLHLPVQEYPEIIKAIETYQYHCHILKSQWFIYSDKTAEQIFNHLSRFIDEDDELFVCEVNANCVSKFNEPRPNKWVDNLHRN